MIFDGGTADAFADLRRWSQMGTIGVEATLRIGERLALKRPDVIFVDVAVSGSKGPAEQGQAADPGLRARRGGSPPRPVFDVGARKTVWAWAKRARAVR